MNINNCFNKYIITALLLIPAFAQAKVSADEAQRITDAYTDVLLRKQEEVAAPVVAAPAGGVPDGRLDDDFH